MKKTDTLKEIILKKKERLALTKGQLSEEELKNRIASLPACLKFIEAISKPRQICLIAEIKKASASLGVIRENFSHIEIAKAYQDAQVSAISVLTEQDFFLGDISYLNEVKNLTNLPVLRKDFIFDKYQIYESRFYGADAVLLIAGIITQDELQEFSWLANELGMDVLVEVHDERELKKVLKLKTISLIGINNRNLHTLEVDLKTVERLFPLIPKEKTVVVESGIKTSQDVLFLKILGVSAVLIGTVFMQAEDIPKKIEEIMGW
ncbi:MAG: indole-3-glycerol phosphate synthase TrpC [Candidatus Omnitrophica bacterium]|nr:indole-3-glycerol phosphate synthase TrpC [Candidatus Omnitrophota bacterium]